ncbi:MAG: DUF1559 domain-containing protein, partial [Planctomycetaceae bacterium]|nr:DUF1559 domain-containing protein [Planctomycetaceae bacterium]
MIRQLRFSRNTKGERVGFTLLELLIVIAILSLLAALFLPAVMNVRASARRVQCSNNMRQIALALFQSEETLGRLPASGNFETSGPKQYHSWVTTILSELEQGNLRQQYRFDLPVDDPANAGLIHNPIAVLVCPEDISVSAGKGNLTYVVNGGFGWTIPVDCPASIRSDPTTTTIAPLDLNGNGVVCPFDPRDDATSG